MKKSTSTTTKRLSKPIKRLNKQLMLVSVKYIAEQVVAEKEKNNGRVPWGYASRLLREGRETFPSMSMRTINNYILKVEKEKANRKVGKTILTVRSATTISALTDEVDAASHNSSHSSSSSSIHSTSDDTESESFDSSDDSIESSVSLKLGGRPKGTTAANAQDLKKRTEAATKEAVVMLAELQTKVYSEKERVNKGALTDIISKCKEKHDVPAHIKVNAEP